MASDDKCRWTHYGALATVAVTAAVQLAVWEQGSTSSFNGMYIADGMSRLAKMVLYALTFVLFVYKALQPSARYFQRRVLHPVAVCPLGHERDGQARGIF
ncbi:hypothetical protein ACR30T_06875 [Neisseria gonorrhoeae]